MPYQCSSHFSLFFFKAAVWPLLSISDFHLPYFLVSSSLIQVFQRITLLWFLFTDSFALVIFHSEHFWHSTSFYIPLVASSWHYYWSSRKRDLVDSGFSTSYNFPLDGCSYLNSMCYLHRCCENFMLKNRKMYSQLISTFYEWSIWSWYRLDVLIVHINHLDELRLGTHISFGLNQIWNFELLNYINSQTTKILTATTNVLLCALPM